MPQRTFFVRCVTIFAKPLKQRKWDMTPLLTMTRWNLFLIRLKTLRLFSFSVME